MASRQSNRFVSPAAPDKGGEKDISLLACLNTYSLQEAVSQFRKEIKESALLAMACNKAESLLRSGKVGSESDSTLDHNSKVAIVVYTLESPNVYMDFNSRSRNLSISTWDSFPYKGMWLLLNKAVMTHARPYRQTNDTQCVKTFYRGIKTLMNVIPGSTFFFRQITSTSLSIKIASDFSTTEGTIFILENTIGLSIKDLSYSPAEEEVIVSGFDKFIVTKVEDTPSGRKIYLSQPEVFILCSIS